MDKDAVMVAGSAGAGKTTLALQYLVNGALSYGEPGIYITFEQLPDQIYRDASSFGWDLRKLEEENMLRIICTSPDLMLSSSGGESILDIPIKDIHPKRIVIDSLSHLQMFIEEKNFRLEVYRLVSELKTKGLSSFMLWETPQMMGQIRLNHRLWNEFSGGLYTPAETCRNRFKDQEGACNSQDEGK